MTRSYFISTDKKIIPVSGRHITMLVQNPEKFGFTQSEIKEVYEKHKEPLGSEGNAREELLLELVSRGWARVREYASRGNEYWSVQVKRLDKTAKEMLQDFTRQAIGGKGPFTIDGKVSKYDEMRIVSLKDGNVVQDNFENITNGSLYTKEELSNIKDQVATLNKMIAKLDPRENLSQTLRNMAKYQREKFMKEKGWTPAQLKYAMGECYNKKFLAPILEWCEIEDYELPAKLTKYLNQLPLSNEK